MIKKIMIFVALASALVFLGNACSGASKSQKYKDLTARSVYETCKTPSEAYPINNGAYGMQAIVMRHDQCVGYDNVLLVIWDGPRTERTETAAKLLMLLYVDFINTQNPDSPMVGFYIKTDKLEVDEEETHMAFYQLRPKEVKK